MLWLKKYISRKKIIIIGFALMALAIYFSFGIFHIGKFMTDDEHYWLYQRIPQYWRGITQGRWALTRIQDKPGITSALLSGTGLLRYANPTQFVDVNDPSLVHNSVPFENFLRVFRLPAVLFNGIFALFFLWIIWKITKNSWLALWSFILILLSPVLIGISQIVNPDGLLWTFSTAVLLSFIAYLQTTEKKMVFFSALFLGLALLTKYTAIILVPFLFVLTVFYYLEKIKIWQEEKKEIAKIFLRNAIAYLVILVGMTVVFAILMPASILKPIYLYLGTIGFSGMQFLMLPIIFLQIIIIGEAFFWKSKFSIRLISFFQKFWGKYAKILFGILALSFILIFVNYSLGHDFLKFERIPFDTYQDPLFYHSPWLIKFLLEFRPLVYAITPIILLGVLFLWLKALIKKLKYNFLTLSLSAFILVFIMASIQEKLLNIVRYSIMVYPLLAIMAGLALDEIFANKKYNRWLIAVTILILSFGSLWLICPYYLDYTNKLLPKKYIISDSWGQGGYEVTQYLNALPNAKNLNVWSDSTGVCEFFIGTCVKAKCVLPENKRAYDYTVFNRRGEILYYQSVNKSPKNQCWINEMISQKIENTKKPTFNLSIDGRSQNFIQAIKTEK